MRMDHFVKTSNNNIHMASILYALAVIFSFVLILGFLLQHTLSKDFKAIEMITNFRRQQRTQRRQATSEDESQGLTSDRA